MSATVLPTAKEFSAAHASARAQLVWKKLPAKAIEPITLYQQLTHSQPYSFLLESAQDGEQIGRHHIIGFAPDKILCYHNATTTTAQLPDLDRPTSLEAKPLDALRAFLADSQLALPDELPAIAAGVFGYLSYEMAAQLERLPEPKSDELGVPDMLFLRPSKLAVLDKKSQALYLICVARGTTGQSANESYAQALEQLQAMEAQLTRDLPQSHARHTSFEEPTSNLSQQDYFDMIEQARAHIVAGDVYQVVLSQRFRVPFALSDIEFYEQLREVNPSPYLFLFRFEDFSIIGSSPETLVEVTNGEMKLNVIAGTRPRHGSNMSEATLAKDLLSDEKERAEHLMLLDLGRNDLGRVCKIGSVRPHKPFAIQKTSHLLHIATKLTGQLRADYDVIEALMAGFPAGTVSGAPKIRAMEIIHKLEPMKRGPYAGGVGYFSAQGDMLSAIMLRTAILKDGMLYVQAGGGIVYDSNPHYEYRECVNKAKALFRAAELAIKKTHQ